MADAPISVLEAVTLLEAEGFGAPFRITDGGLRCGACATEHVADTADVVGVYRFEGPSDPDEQAIVYALRCPVCGSGGTLVSAYGPGADPAIADRLVMLDARFSDHPGS